MRRIVWCRKNQPISLDVINGIYPLKNRVGLNKRLFGDKA